MIANFNLKLITFCGSYCMRISRGDVSASLWNLKDISLCYIMCRTVYQFLFPIPQVWNAHCVTSRFSI